MELPRNSVQLSRAVLEDALLDLVFADFEEFVLHGGAAVWRCYSGNRFSRALDFYTNQDPDMESELQKKLHKLLTDKGYIVIEEGYVKNTLTLHMIIRGDGTTGKLDLTFGHAKGAIAEYERVDGSKEVIYAIPPEEIMNEKISTYADKFGKGSAEIQDLYDMFVLKNLVTRPSEKTRKALGMLLLKIAGNPPKNEKELSNVLLSGPSPSFEDIVNSLRKWLHDNTN